MCNDIITARVILMYNKLFLLFNPFQVTFIGTKCNSCCRKQIQDTMIPLHDTDRCRFLSQERDDPSRGVLCVPEWVSPQLRRSGKDPELAGRV